MKDVLFILSKSDGMSRTQIMRTVERNRWNRLAKRSTAPTMRYITDLIPLDKTRVSYDRTFRRLRELGLIERGFPSDRRLSSWYSGTILEGYFYVLTDKGRREAEEIIEEILKPLLRYSDMLTNVADQELEI
jgi:DNA-binding transcriptional ArsR family regulator